MFVIYLLVAVSIDPDRIVTAQIIPEAPATLPLVPMGPTSTSSAGATPTDGCDEVCQKEKWLKEQLEKNHDAKREARWRSERRSSGLSRHSQGDDGDRLLTPIETKSLLEGREVVILAVAMLERLGPARW